MQIDFSTQNLLGAARIQAGLVSQPPHVTGMQVAYSYYPIREQQIAAAIDFRERRSISTGSARLDMEKN